MPEKQSLQRLRSSVDLASRGVNGIGVTLLMGMMLLIVVDVFLRRVFSRPIMGSFEIVQFTLCMLVYLGLAYTTIQKAHISVDLLVTKFSEGTRVLIESLTLLLSLGFFILITWRNIPRGRELWLEKATSALLSIPTFPFYYVLAFGCGLLCLVLLVQMVPMVLMVRMVLMV